jgi:polar amino acid transport system substrate-binding protein
MKSGFLLPICVLCLAVILSAACTGAGGGKDLSSLTYVTEEYLPYNYMENGSVTGIAVDILNEIAADAGTPIPSKNIRLMEWGDAYNTALSTPNTVIFSIARLPERETDFKWAGPFATQKKVLFAIKSSSITINGPEDLKRYTIGVVTNDAAIGQLKAFGVPQKNMLADPDPAVIIESLQNGDIDLWCYGMEAGMTSARKATGSSSFLEPVYTLDSYDLYYAFNRNTPDQVVALFQQRLDSVIRGDNQSGTDRYETIMRQYLSS